MRSAHLAACVACIAASLLAPPTRAGSPRALLVRGFSPGALAETTWVEASDGGVRVLGDGAGVRLAPPAPGATGAADTAARLRWARYLVRLEEHDRAPSFVAHVSARRALAERFVAGLARSQPSRFGARGADGIRVVRTYDRLIAGVALEAPAGSLPALRAVPGVARIDPDLAVRTLLDRSVPQVRGDVVRNALHGTGRGVRVGIVDTGIDYRHPAFGGAFGPGARVVGGADLVNHDEDPLDDHGHGTHVAGIVAGNGGGVTGMATEATLYAYKVLTAQGWGFTSDVIAGLERCADPDQDPATDDRLDVVNLSLGAYGGDPDDAFSRAVDALDALGTTVVVAAGNAGGQFMIANPAIARGALAVGATMRADTTAPFSSRGPGPDLTPKPDLLAPGDAILSAALGGGRIAMSGTSMAAPHVAGAAAVLRQLHPEWTRDEVRAALVGASHDVGRAVFEQGAGRLDAWAAATATLFATPTRLAFGRVVPGRQDTVLTRMLRLHSRSATSATLTLSVTTEYPPVPGVDVAVAPTSLTLPPGGDTSVTVTVAFHATRPANRKPPFLIEGLIEVRAGGEVRHVPYAVHDCFQLGVTINGGYALGVVHDGQRIWPSKGFESTWLLPAGEYDAMGFGNNGLEQPVRLVRGIHLAADGNVDLASVPLDRTLTWSITDAARRPLARAKMDLAFRHASGVALGYIGFPAATISRLPEAGPDYRLEWGVYQDDGPVRHDIAGTVDGPFTDGTAANDPTRLRRVSEHFAVTPGDSVLPVEFRLHPDGAGGEFGIAIVNPLTPPTVESYDVVQWRSPTPYRGHYRIGRWDWQMRPRALRGEGGDWLAGMGPPLSLDRGDTVGIHRERLSDRPTLAITGSRLSFGTGPLVFNAGMVAETNDFVLVRGAGYSGRLFSDMLGTKLSGRAASFEVQVDGRVVLADTLEGEGHVENTGLYQRLLSLLPGNRGTLVVRSRDAGMPGSRTTVRTDFGLGVLQTITPTLEAFAVLANGSVVEEVRFGQVRAPHVEFVVRPPLEREPLVAELHYRRTGTLDAWTPLAVTGAGGRFSAPLAPAEGPVSLRLRVGTVKWGTLEMDVEPAFTGRRSPGADAPVMQATADAAGVQVTWRVPATDGALVVERSEPDGPWIEWGDVTPANGVAHYEDAAVVPGKRYGYRLAGAEAVAWVQIPVGVPRLSLAIAPNPARGEVVLALSVDRTEPIQLSLLDLQGRVMSTRRVNAPPPGALVLRLAPSGRVPPGLYFVRLVRGSDEIIRRVTLLE